MIGREIVLMIGKINFELIRILFTIHFVTDVNIGYRIQQIFIENYVRGFYKKKKYKSSMNYNLKVCS